MQILDHLIISLKPESISTTDQTKTTNYIKYRSDGGEELKKVERGGGGKPVPRPPTIWIHVGHRSALAYPILQWLIPVLQ